ncbi:hypothetical protein NEOLEDRAFT_1142493 [Neolentinus lepideus HHB14362 ss-1]|uniref:C2H2-type domain-containing protein n=1 Tax=Neolentinus lepideus HHB14362 ss-1 TaxID=1314782 RepID=A0A165N3S3_9AGAM|nr:hypothetical protein NEOLEDRAFT_1142493 [Neolentinus lepideus HHB14362 ss-1]
MSYIFSLEKLAQHKLFMEFPMPGKPPSIEWAPLPHAIRTTSAPTSILSLRVDVNCINGKNVLELFIIESPEATKAHTESRRDPSSSSVDGVLHHIRATTAATSSSMSPHRAECVLAPEYPVPSTPASRKTSLLEQAAYNRLSRQSSGFASPAMCTNTTLPPPNDHHAPPAIPNGLDWIPSAGPSQDWQRFAGALEWSGQHAYPSVSHLHLYQPHPDSGLLDPIGHYSSASPDVFHGGEPQAVPHSSATCQWTPNEEFSPAASSPTPRLSHSLSSYSQSSAGSILTRSVSVGSTQSEVTTSGVTVYTPPASDALLPAFSSAISNPTDYFSAVHSEPANHDATTSPAPSSSTDGDTQTGSTASPQFHCKYDGCNRTFRNQYTYSVHSGAHIKKTKKRFECPTCCETFSRRHDMMRHEVSQHGKVPDWTCERCRRFLSSKTMFKNHKCPAIRKPGNPALAVRETTSFYC